jgi:hypothetical protein
MGIAMESPEDRFFQRAASLFPEIGPAIEVATEAGDGVWATKLENFADVTRAHIKSGDFAKAAAYIDFVCRSIDEMPSAFQEQIKLCFFDWFWSGLNAEDIERFAKHLESRL